MQGGEEVKPYYQDDHVTLYPDTTVREDDSRDTEQQIEDGTELLTLLGLTLEEQP